MTERQLLEQIGEDDFRIIDYKKNYYRLPFTPGYKHCTKFETVEVDGEPVEEVKTYIKQNILNDVTKTVYAGLASENHVCLVGTKEAVFEDVVKFTAAITHVITNTKPMVAIDTSADIYFTGNTTYIIGVKDAKDFDFAHVVPFLQNYYRENQNTNIPILPKILLVTLIGDIDVEEAVGNIAVVLNHYMNGLENRQGK